MTILLCGVVVSASLEGTTMWQPSATAKGAAIAFLAPRLGAR